MAYQKSLEWISFILSFIVLASQLGLIGIYFINYIGTQWLYWYIFGVAILIHWSFIIFKHVKPDDGSRLCDKMSKCYIGWLVYCTNLISSVIILFYRVTDQLKKTVLLGPRLLKLILSFTPFLFVVFVYGHYYQSGSQPRNYYVE